MSLMSRILVGWRLSLSSIRYVLRDKSLLYFPLTSAIFILVTVGLFYIAVGPDKMKLFINTRFNDLGVQYVNWGYYMTVLLAYLGLSVITMVMNAALVACADRTMQGEDTTYKQGIVAALSRIFGIVPWALISSTVGLLFTLMDQERRCSKILRNWFGASWSTLTYFVLPVMVVERRNVFSAFRRSKELMRNTWGENLQPRFGLFWLLLLLNTPILLAGILIQFSEWNFNHAIGLIMLLYFGVTVLLAQTARAVLNVALHHFATDRIVKGFTIELLREAFKRRPDAAPTKPEDQDPIDVKAFPVEGETSMQESNAPDVEEVETDEADKAEPTEETETEETEDEAEKTNTASDDQQHEEEAEENTKQD